MSPNVKEIVDMHDRLVSECVMGERDRVIATAYLLAKQGTAFTPPLSPSEREELFEYLKRYVDYLADN